MTTELKRRELFGVFSNILDYPSLDLQNHLLKCRELCSDSPEILHLVATFHQFVNNEELRTLEEIYTRTFDLQMVCYPYVGYQLFGESYKRGAFLAKLREIYRQFHFNEGNELPDHLMVLLRFFSVVDNDAMQDEIISEAFVPALQKMLQSFKNDTNPYRPILQALEMVMQQTQVMYA